MAYLPGETYRVRQIVDIPNHSYRIYVTASGGEEQLVAEDFAFRGGQETLTSLDHMVLMSGAGSMEACLLSLQPVDPPVHVGISPSSVELEPSASQQFEATVTGTANTAVTWSVEESECGVITAGGMYTAPSEEKTCNVKASSMEDENAFAIASVQVKEPSGENPYLEPVNIPTYDAENPEHLLITVANGKWTSANLNSSTYKHFYIEPGYYGTTRSDIVTLTRSGTESDRRTLSLLNGNDIHPAALSDNQQADLRIRFDNASYWTIDRVSTLSAGASDAAANYDMKFLYNGSSQNVINRYHYKNFYYGFRICHQSNYNTIQNSYLNHMNHEGRLSDNVGISLTPEGQGEGTRIIGTRIIRNDIRNMNDGVQLVVPGDTGNYIQDVYYPGTILDDNRMWYDGDVYTNNDHSTNGYSQDPGSAHQIGEQPGFDLKAGGLDGEGNGITITNNIIWGSRDRDETSSQGPGSAYVIHNDSSYITMERNIMFDNFRVGGSGLSFNHSTFKHNIIAFTASEMPDPPGSHTYLHHFYKNIDLKVENNSFVGLQGDFYQRFENTSQDTFSYNLMIDVSANQSTSINNTNFEVTGNYYYNTPHRIATTGTEYVDAGDTGMTDYTFQYERFTASPKTKTLTGVVSTGSSLHYGVAGSNIEN